MRRTEVKFMAESFQLAGFYRYLTACNATTLHPPRLVNSLYFDTATNLMFRETIEGITPRKKYRLRWYGSGGPKPGEVSVEVKTTSSSGREKSVGSLNPLTPLLAPAELESYGIIFPSVRVSYLREYFNLEGMRLTIDQDIRYHYPDDLDSEAGGLVSTAIAVEGKSPKPSLEEKFISEIGLKTRHFSKFEQGMCLIHNLQT